MATDGAFVGADFVYGIKLGESVHGMMSGVTSSKPS